MDYKKIFLSYGLVLITIGVVGYIMMGPIAKSGLISGGICGTLMVICGLTVDKQKAMLWVGTVLNAVIAGMYGWRYSILFEKIQTGACGKLPFLLLGLGLSVSLLALGLTIKKIRKH